MPLVNICPVLALNYGLRRFSVAAPFAATVGGFFSISTVVALLPAAWLASVSLRRSGLVEQPVDPRSPGARELGDA